MMFLKNHILNRRFSFNRRGLGLVVRAGVGEIALIASVASFCGFSLPAQAALTVADLSMLYSGKAPFDANDLAGNDSSPANTVIRSQDDLGYRLNYQTTGGDTNVVLSLVAPAGATWKFLPSACTASSVISGPVLTCVLGDMPSSQTQAIDFEMNVGPRGQGQNVSPPTVSFVSNETGTTPADPTPPPALTTSAAPRWDAVKLTADTASVFRKGSGPLGEDGFIMRYNILLQAQNYQNRGADSVKGLAPLGSTITITDPLPTPNARIMDYSNPFQTTPCVNQPGGAFQNTPYLYDSGPVAKNDANDPTHRYVANGGACSASQSGSTATVTLTGVDSTLSHRVGLVSFNTPLPSSDIRTTTIVSKNLFVWIPATDIASTEAGTTTVNTLPAVTFTSADGTQTVAESDTSNNSSAIRVRNWPEGYIQKTNYIWTVWSTTPRSAADAPGGVPTGYTDAVFAAVPGTRWKPSVTASNTGSVDWADPVFCDYFDNSRFNLIERAPGVYASIDAFTDVNGNPLPAANISAVEYGSGNAAATLDPNGQWTSVSVAGSASAQSSASCNDPNVTWVTDPTTLPGGVGSVTRLRVRYQGDFEPGHAGTFSYGVEMRSTWLYNTQVLAPSAYAGTYSAGSPIAPADNYFSPNPYGIDNIFGLSSASLTSEYRSRTTNGVLRPSVYNGIVKTSVNPANTSINPVAIGQNVTYGLDVYSRNLVYVGTENLVVTDILPPGLIYVPGTSSYAGNASQTGVRNAAGLYGGVPGTLLGEPTVTGGAPGCPTCTTLVWMINNSMPGTSIDNSGPESLLGQLQFQARVDIVANGTQLLNAATIDSDHDIAGDCVYQGPTQGFGGAGCNKASGKTITVSAPPGFYINKTTSAASQVVNGPINFALALSSVGGDVRNARWIDILPYNGDSSIRSGGTGTSYAGTLALSSLTPSAGVVVSYTKMSPAGLSPDPNHADNDATPASFWCTSLSGGSCPANLAEVTALRFEAAQLTSDTVYTVQLALQPSGNNGGDVYINAFQATGEVNNLTPTLTSPSIRVDVTAASVTLTKQISGNAEGYTGGIFSATLTCTVSPTAGGTASSFSRTVSLTPGMPVTVNSVPPTTADQTVACEVTENTTSRPALAHSGYEYGAPVISPASFNAPSTGGSQAVTVTNPVLVGAPGSLTITKVVSGQMPDSGVSGTFSFAVSCSMGVTIPTQTITLNAATTGSVTVPDIPSGAVCSVTEQGPLPSLPVSYAYGALPPAAAMTAMASGGAQTVTITNVVSKARATPAPVPLTREWLVVTFALLCGLAMRVRRQQDCRSSGRK